MHVYLFWQAVRQERKAQSNDRFHTRFPFLAPSRRLAQLQHGISLLSTEAAEN